MKNPYLMGIPFLEASYVALAVYLLFHIYYHIKRHMGQCSLDILGVNSPYPNRNVSLIAQSIIPSELRFPISE